MVDTPDREQNIIDNRINIDEDKKKDKNPFSAENINKNAIKAASSFDVRKAVAKEIDPQGEIAKTTNKQLLEKLNGTKKVERKDILKSLDGRIENSLATSVRKTKFDDLAKVVKNPETGKKFKTPEAAKKFLREQFLNGEIKSLNTEKEFKKDGKKIKQTEKSNILSSNPDIKKAFENVKDKRLQDELLVIYGKDGLDGYTDLFKDKKIESIEDFEKFRKEEIIKRGIEAGKWKVVDGKLVERTEEEKKEAKENMKKAMKDPKVAKQMAKKMSGYKGISESQAKNVQAEKLDLTGNAMERSLSLIKHFEGFVSVSYWDYRQYSRGYGTKAPGSGARITKEAATKQLENQVQNKYNLKTELTKRGLGSVYDKLGPNQIAALTSFIYNLGPGKLKGFKTLLSNYPNSKNQIAEKMKKYNKAGGSILKGLVRRRKTEAELFLNEEGSTNTTDSTKSNDKTDTNKTDTFKNFLGGKKEIGNIDYKAFGIKEPEDYSTDRNSESIKPKDLKEINGILKGGYKIEIKNLKLTLLDNKNNDKFEFYNIEVKNNHILLSNILDKVVINKYGIIIKNNQKEVFEYEDRGIEDNREFFKPTDGEKFFVS